MLCTSPLFPACNLSCNVVCMYICVSAFVVMLLLIRYWQLDRAGGGNTHCVADLLPAKLQQTGQQRQGQTGMLHICTLRGYSLFLSLAHSSPCPSLCLCVLYRLSGSQHLTESTTFRESTETLEIRGSWNVSGKKFLGSISKSDVDSCLSVHINPVVT